MADNRSRREFLALAASTLVPAHASALDSHQATGVKVGELTSTSAHIWTRRTRSSARKARPWFVQRMAFGGGCSEGKLARPLDVDPSRLEGSCPGEAGELRVILRTGAGKAVAATRWTEVGADSDFSHQFSFEELLPDVTYHYTVETRSTSRIDGALSGLFRTAPNEDALAAVQFAMLSCQRYTKRDDRDGYHLHDAIRRAAPNFYLSAGDNVYYDDDHPVANTRQMARHHWHRMFSLPRLRECTRTVPGYWLKDDHDTYADDTWPGSVNRLMLPLTWQEARNVFSEQVPTGTTPYRRVRWGRGLELFLLESRDFRTASDQPDGPTKTIWGEGQKLWLKRGLQDSTAEWRVIVSPTPVVGPDRPNKHDNHANDAFFAEGMAFRQWLKASGARNTIILTGDRHWQYHSVDCETNVEEFCCGPASDAHATGSPGENSRYHRFHRVQGGFLLLRVQWSGGRSRLVIEHRDTRGVSVYRNVKEAGS